MNTEGAEIVFSAVVIFLCTPPFDTFLWVKMGGEQFFTKHHTWFPGNEESLAQGMWQQVSIARRMLFEVVDTDASS